VRPGPDHSMSDGARRRTVCHPVLHLLTSFIPRDGVCSADSCVSSVAVKCLTGPLHATASAPRAAGRQPDRTTPARPAADRHPECDSEHRANHKHATVVLLATTRAASTTKPRTVAAFPLKPSAVIDTRVIYCGDNLDQLAKLPDACVDLIYIDPLFNSNRNYEVFLGETQEKRAFEDRHASAQAYIEFMRPRCVELARGLKHSGSLCDGTTAGKAGIRVLEIA
jgi:hypothetical protein